MIRSDGNIVHLWTPTLLHKKIIRKSPIQETVEDLIRTGAGITIIKQNNVCELYRIKQNKTKNKTQTKTNKQTKKNHNRKKSPK